MKFIITTLLLFATVSLFAQDKSTETEALLIVKLQDMEGEAKPAGEIIVFEGRESDAQVKGISDAEGQFKVLLPEGDTYLIKIKGFGEEEDYSELEIPEVEGAYSTQIMTLKYEITEPKTYTLDNVHFDVGLATIRSNSYSELDELVELMLAKETLVIEIAGHTDNDGSDATNMNLSKLRAEAVRKYLISKGVPTERVSAKGYGETQPVASNDTAEGRQKNRRTEVRVLKR